MATKRKQDRPEVKDCERCGASFPPANYLSRYCSPACQIAAGNARLRHTCGPCPTCGKYFPSRNTNKKFCTMDCYVKSDQFISHLEQAGKKACSLYGTPRTCRGCGVEYPRSKRSKFCTRQCQRLYFAKRFDRWIANPEAVALPQNFDEFLARNVLSCPIGDCDWEGTNLGAHVNHVHGITAREFKKLAGFNLSTGLVGLEVSALMAEKAKRMQEEGVLLSGVPDSRRPTNLFERYISLEAKEHAAKARADMPTLREEFRPCRGCSVAVQQPAMGRKLYCSELCRDQHYSEAAKALRRQASYSLACSRCHEAFQGNRYQFVRSQLGLPVCCSPACKGRLNSPAGRPKRKRGPVDDRPAQ